MDRSVGFGLWVCQSCGAMIEKKLGFWSTVKEFVRCGRLSGGCVGAWTPGVWEMLATRLSGSLGCWKGGGRKLEDALLLLDMISKSYPFETGSANKGRLNLVCMRIEALFSPIARQPENFLLLPYRRQRCDWSWTVEKPVV